MPTLTNREVIRLALDAGCDERTAWKWLARGRVRPDLAERLSECARTLGYTPEPPTEATTPADGEPQ